MNYTTERRGWEERDTDCHWGYGGFTEQTFCLLEFPVPSVSLTVGVSIKGQKQKEMNSRITLYNNLI